MPLVLEVPTYVALRWHTNAAPRLVVPKVAFPGTLLIASTERAPACRCIDAGDLSRVSKAELQRHGDSMIRQRGQRCVLIDRTPAQLRAREQGRGVPNGLRE